MKAIKSIFGFILTIQIFALVLFMLYFFSENMYVMIPIELQISDEIEFTFNLEITTTNILLFLIAISTFFVLSGLTVTAIGGLNDSATNTVKRILAYITIYALLVIPINFIFSKSDFLIDFQLSIDLFILLIYMLQFLNNSEGAE